jgi:hypothetical protein
MAEIANKAAEQLLMERMGRLRAAVALREPERVPLSLVMDAFAARTMGVKLSDFVKDVDVAGAAMLGTMEKLGDVDSIEMGVYAPAVLVS